MATGDGESIFLHSTVRGRASPYAPTRAGLRTMRTMNIEQMIEEKLRMLSLEQQQEVLGFVEFLQQKKSLEKRPRRSLRGLWADLGVRISEEDIAEARREMWRTFPREDI